MMQINSRKDIIKLDHVGVRKYVASILDRFEPMGFNPETDGAIYVVDKDDTLSSLEAMNLLTQDRLVEYVNETNDLYEVVYITGDSGAGIAIVINKECNAELLKRCQVLAYQLEGIMTTTFQLGQVITTPNALKALEEHQLTVIDLLARYVSCDWGETSVEDIQINQQALTDSGRLFATYSLSTEVSIWVITQANRTITEVLLPEEY